MSNFLFHKDQEWDGFPLSIFILSGGFTLLVAILILLVTNSFLESHFSVFATVYMQAVDYLTVHFPFYVHYQPKSIISKNIPFISRKLGLQRGEQSPQPVPE